MKLRRQFEFSAEKLSEDAKCIKIILFAEPLMVTSFIYVQSLQEIVNKSIKHTIFSIKMPNWHQIPANFMIHALLSRNFAVRVYALFPQIFWDRRAKSADFYTFRMYAWPISCSLDTHRVTFLTVLSKLLSPVLTWNVCLFVNKETNSLHFTEST